MMLFHAEAGSQTSTPTPTGRTARIKTLSEQELDKIQNMSSASELEPAERKRQYSALRRAINKSMNPALTMKFRMANDGERFLT